MTQARTVGLLAVLAGATLGCGTEYSVGGGTVGGSGSGANTEAGTEGSAGTDGGSGGCVMCGPDCVDVSSDPQNCGSCGDSCGDGKICVNGDCTDACDPACKGDLEVCDGDQCVCRSGLTPCEGECVDLRTDPSHCGTCGDACPEACGDSTCQPASCTGFPQACDGACTDPQSDPLNCGSCGDTCEASETCADGQCTDTG